MLYYIYYKNGKMYKNMNNQNYYIILSPLFNMTEYMW